MTEVYEYKSRKSTITGMSYPRCPPCKERFEKVVSNNGYKAFYCKKCNHYLNERQTLKGWVASNHLKDAYVEKIFEQIRTIIEGVLCPICKDTLKENQNNWGKLYSCSSYDSYFEKWEFLQGWIESPKISEEFIDKIWKEIIQEIQLNLNDDIEDTTKRLAFAKMCKSYNQESKEDWLCKKEDPDSDGFFNITDKNRPCYLAGQASVHCYKKKAN